MRPIVATVAADDPDAAVHGYKYTDHEVLGTRFPVRVDAFSIRHGSGGDGAFKGGDGIIRKRRFLEPMTLTVLTSHRKTAPYGANGGSAGATGEDSVIRTDGTRSRCWATTWPKWTSTTFLSSNLPAAAVSELMR